MFSLARHRRSTAGTAAAVLLALTATGCGVLIGPSNGEVSDDITVTSPMLREGEKIPDRYTCAGEGMSPPLRWSGLPAETESLALVVDTVYESGGAAVHWVVYGLDPDNPGASRGDRPHPRTARDEQFRHGQLPAAVPGERQRARVPVHGLRPL